MVLTQSLSQPLDCEYVCLIAGLPPPPELPLPPGLDSAAAAPYQQKPIDLFKAIFEASDSEEEEEEQEPIEDTIMEDAKRRSNVRTAKVEGSQGRPGPVPEAQTGVIAGQQGSQTAGIVAPHDHACQYPCFVCAAGLRRLPGI